MILMTDIPFERTARMLRENVCDMPKAVRLPAVEGVSAGGMKAGLADLLALLGEIYADLSNFRRADDPTSTTAMIDAVRFLHGCLHAGRLETDEGGFVCVVGKADLKKAIKRGGLGPTGESLSPYGLAVGFRRGGEPCGAIARADELVLSTTRHRALLPAAWALATAAAEASQAEVGHAEHAREVFLKGDHDAATGVAPPTRVGLDPLRPDVLRTVGRHEKRWRDLVAAFDELGTSCTGMFGCGVSPVWSVSFSEPRRRPLAIFTLAFEVVFIEFTLPVAAAEGIIRRRASLPPSIRRRIETLHCVHCPKKCAGKNTRKVDGVTLCTGRAEARRLYLPLAEPDEFAAITSMVRALAADTRE